MTHVNLTCEDLLLLTSVDNGHPGCVTDFLALFVPQSVKVLLKGGPTSSLFFQKQVSHQAFITLENKELIVEVLRLC